MAILDHSLPLQVKAPDMMGMLDQGSQLAQFYTQQKSDGELNRLYKETNGDLNKMMEIGKTSPMARFVMPQLQAQQAAQQKAALDQQKIEADIGKTKSEAFKNNQQGGGFNLDNTAKLMDKANQALYVATRSGDANAVKLALNNAKSAGLFDSNPEAYNQYFATVEGLSTNPEGLKSFALNLQKAYAQNPEKYNFTTADNVLDNQTSADNNIRTNQTSENNSIRAAETSRYSTDVGAQTAANRLTVDQARIELEQKKGVVQQFGDSMYMVYPNGSAVPISSPTGQPMAPKLKDADRGKVAELVDLTNSAQEGIKSIQKARGLSNQGLYDGFGSTTRAGIMGTFGGTEESRRTQEYDALITQSMLSSLKATFGGNPTEGEREILRQVQASSSYPIEVREAILQNAENTLKAKLSSYQQQQGIYKGGQPDTSARPSGGKPNALDFFK